MTIISKNSVVTLDYQLKAENGEVIDSSAQTGPMIYIQGAEDILAGIEDAVNVLSVDDTTTAVVTPEDAYGEYDPEKVGAVPRSAFVGIDDLQVGMQVQEETEDGPLLITIREVNEEQVIIDSNHPLAGLTLNFELQVMAIRDATKEELDHGHVHSGHGHDH